MHQDKIMRGEQRMEKSGFRVIWPEENRIRFQKVPFLLTLLSVVGMLFCLHGMFYSEISYGPLIAISLPVVCVAYLMGQSKRNLWIGGGVITVLFLLTLLMFGSYFAAGVADFLNQLIGRYNYITGKTWNYFVVPQCPNEMVAHWCFVGWLAVIFACYLYQVIQRKHPILLFICWLPILAGSLYLQLSLGGLMTAWAVVSVVGTFAYSQVKVDKDTVYAVAILVLFLVLSGSGILYFHFVTYYPNEQIEATKKDIIRQIEYRRFGVPDYPEGDLEREVIDSADLRLKVQLSGEARIYLKGYTGSVYEDSYWNLLEPTSYGDKYEGMIREYRHRLFHPLTQQYSYMEMSEQVAGAEVSGEKITVTVENIGASQKYVYFPYGVSFQSLTALDGIYQDVNVLYTKDEAKKVTYDVKLTPQDALLSYQGTEWLNAQYDINEETANYRMSESDYRKFVYEKYLDLDSKTYHQWEKELSEDIQGLSELTKVIRQYLLEKGEKETGWNPMNYATFGTLLYRYYGVPARYVEGYLVEGNGEVEVTAQNAHAWVEVYKDGIGWIPVDVTPGFYGEILAPEKSEQQQSTANQGQSTEENVREEEKKEESATYHVAWYWMLLVGVVVLIGVCLIGLLVLWIRYKALWKRRQQEMEESDRVVRLRYLSSYLYEITKYLSMQEEELSREVRIVLSILWYRDNPELMIEEEQVGLVRLETASLQKLIWDKAGRIEKWLLRYWYHMEFPVLEDNKE